MTDTITDAPPFHGFEGTPPHDIEAEQAVLGSMLLSRSAIADVVELLQVDDFYRPAHRTIYDVITDAYGRGKGVDAIIVHDELRKAGLVSAIGGATYLHTLAHVVPTPVNAGHYADIVREQATLRRLAEAGARIQARALSPSGESPEELMDLAQADLNQVTGARASEDYAPMATIMPGALDGIEANSGRGEGIVGVPSGFKDLDTLTNGWQGGQFIVVAARPAIGKSTLGVDFLRSCCVKEELPGIMFSLEMSRQEIVYRVLSAEARVGLHNIRSGKLSDEDWGKLGKHMGPVAEAPLFIDDSPNMSMSQIQAKAHRLKERQGLNLIVVDYLQLMSSPKKTESRQNEVSEISRALKLMAKELDVPVVGISQLNRDVERRTDRIPMISDLRESGSIEQDADIIILLNRPDAYEKESSRAGEADLIVAKHRNGPTTTVTVAFQGHYSRFVDMAPSR